MRFDQLLVARGFFEGGEPGGVQHSLAAPARELAAAARGRECRGRADEPPDQEGTRTPEPVVAVHGTIVPVKLVTLGDVMLDVIVRLKQPLAHGDDVRARTRTGAGAGGRLKAALTVYPPERPRRRPERQLVVAVARRRPPLGRLLPGPVSVLGARDASSMAGRIYARAAGMRFYHRHWLSGTATNWQNHRLPGSASFTVELPAGSLSAEQVRRQVGAVLTLAPAMHGPGPA